MQLPVRRPDYCIGQNGLSQRKTGWMARPVFVALACAGSDCVRQDHDFDAAVLRLTLCGQI